MDGSRPSRRAEMRFPRTPYRCRARRGLTQGVRRQLLVLQYQFHSTAVVHPNDAPSPSLELGAGPVMGPHTYSCVQLCTPVLARGAA